MGLERIQHLSLHTEVTFTELVASASRLEQQPFPRLPARLEVSGCLSQLPGCLAGSLPRATLISSCALIQPQAAFQCFPQPHITHPPSGQGWDQRASRLGNGMSSKTFMIFQIPCRWYLLPVPSCRHFLLPMGSRLQS